MQGHRSAAAKWLSQELLDPNDPRNAALLELLRTRSAAANSGAGPGGMPDLFRCGTVAAAQAGYAALHAS
jgi:hypothetical protein